MLTKFCKIFLFLSFISLTFYACKKNVILVGLGSNAKDLLSSNKYNTLIIEVQYMPGFAPNATTLTNLQTFLNTIINKPNGIIITTTQINSIGNSSLSLSDAQTIEKNNRTITNNKDTIGVYALFTDGDYAQNTGNGKVLGVAYSGTSIVMFGKSIADNSGRGGGPSRVQLESIVIEHEFGHLLGLVNIGTPMQTNHIDAAHGNHCNVQNCLMYYEAENGFLGGLGNNIPTLDAQCRADLHANGGK